MNSTVACPIVIPSLTVGLLETSTGRATTELLRLLVTRVSDQQRAVVRQQQILDLLLGHLIDD